jgi:FAD/FMN-containing dehydrogenase
VPISRRAFLAVASVATLGLRRQDPLDRFRRAFTGSVVRPDDADYDRARALASLNPRTDKHPRLIARCLHADDVRRALDFARSQSVEIAVRAGGHDLLGASTCEDGLVIDLSPMRAITIDRDQLTARVEGGVRAGSLNGAAGAYGLAAVLGCNPGVGVAGLTLGGGLGWFLGRFGAACDHVVSMDVVTADGALHHVSASEDADLFWALRGGGGNFGIVTAIEYRLHPVDAVLGGPIALRGDLGAFLRFYRDFMREAPDALAAEVSILMLDEPTILCTPCWSGDLAEGERVLRPLRAFGPPVADAIATVPYAHLTDRASPDFSARVFGPPPAAAAAQAPAVTYDYWKGGCLSDLSNEAIAQLLAPMASASRGMSIGLGHYMHGAICRVPPEATPLIRTAGQFTYFVDASWRSATRAEAAMAWVDQTWAAMRPWWSAGTYVNYLSRDDDDAVRASYGAHYPRLVALKRRFDPANTFHRNRNIRP